MYSGLIEVLRQADANTYYSRQSRVLLLIAKRELVRRLHALEQSNQQIRLLDSIATNIAH